MSKQVTIFKCYLGKGEFSIWSKKLSENLTYSLRYLKLDMPGGFPLGLIYYMNMNYDYSSVIVFKVSLKIAYILWPFFIFKDLSFFIFQVRKKQKSLPNSPDFLRRMSEAGRQILATLTSRPSRFSDLATSLRYHRSIWLTNWVNLVSNFGSSEEK